MVAALTEQAGQLNVHTRYLHESVLDYAEKLLATMPAELRRVMFTCTGSEANDLALRIACDYTGGTGVIVTQYAGSHLQSGTQDAEVRGSPSHCFWPFPVGRDRQGTARNGRGQ